MLPILLTLGGIVIQTYSLFQAYRLYTAHKKIAGGIYRLIPIFIAFFTCGYLIFLYELIKTYGENFQSGLLISLIFFFGAAFVFVVLRINSSLIDRLAEKADTLLENNENLKKYNSQLEIQKTKLLESENKLKNLTEELSKTMNDFYTLRLSLEEKTDDDNIKVENAVVKSQLDKLKKY